MKNFIKITTKKLIIYIVIFMIVLSSITPVAYGFTSEEIGSAVADFAKQVVDTYGKSGKGSVKYRQVAGDQFDNPESRGGESGHCRTDNPIWNSNYSWDDEYIYFDCSSFATGCYHYVTGLINTAWSTSYLSGEPADMKGVFEKIRWDKDVSSLKAGDLMFWNYGSDGHAWIYNGDGTTSEDASYHRKIEEATRSNDVYIWRISEDKADEITDLKTDFSGSGISSGGIKSANAKSIAYSKFYFNGIPNGEYSLANRKNIFQIMVDKLKQLLQYLVSMIQYLFRGLLVSIISVFDRLLNNSMKSIEKSASQDLEDSGIEVQDADDPIKLHRYVTIEDLVFDNNDLFKVNIFDAD